MKKLFIFMLIISFSGSAFAGTVKDRLKKAKEQEKSITSTESKLRKKRVKKNRVEFYMTTWCPYSVKMEKFMKENKIKYSKYDIEKDKDAQKRYKEMKGETVPLLKVNDTIIRGYDTEGLLSALE